MMQNVVAFLALGLAVEARYIEKRQASSNTVPQVFQTTPQVFAGPTPTGAAPFLAQSNPAPFGTNTFVPNTPLETAVPITGNTNNQSIFQLFGQLSSYFPNPSGFGVNEYPLPPGSNITQVQTLHRHGARYPTTGSGVELFGGRIKNATGKYNATGALSFLNTWTYQLGDEVLVPRGRQELFDSGVYYYYQYGKLYNPSTKIIARTTTQDRMLKSAENFMTGFFGLDWVKNATLEVIIEQNTYNNSLAGYYGCPNSNTGIATGGDNASAIWQSIYLSDATKRLQGMITGYNWTLADTYSAQSACAYETVAFGYSAFCNLFNYTEWQGYEYSVDLSFNGDVGFQSPTGRAVGIGYQQEIMARLANHTLNTPNTSANITLDNNTVTFPLNQTLYFDFSHDTNIMAILTAFGFTQFKQFLPTNAIPPSHNLTVSHLEPFGARLSIEVIKTPQPVPANRSTNYVAGNATTYVHFLLNQRTLPLGVSFPGCGNRVDGWCEIGAFMSAQANQLALANFTYACFGNYAPVPYGNVTNGAPGT